MPYVPYGLLSLQAVAQRHEAPVQVLQLAPLSGLVFRTSDELASRIADLVDADRFEAVGLSTMCSSFHHSLGAALELKHRKPDLRIWMGGPQASAKPQAVLARFPEIEAVFVGEAEATFQDLLAEKAAFGRRRLVGVPGIYTRGASFVSRTPMQDLDDLPYVGDASDFLPALSLSGDAPSEVPLEAERGCPGRCSFCSTSLYWGRRVRRKSPVRLLAEMKRLKLATGHKSFSLIGDNMAASRQALLGLCAHIACDGTEVKWACSLTLSRLSARDLDLLWEGGCRSLFVGLESASQETLDKIGKKVDLSKSLGLIDRALAKGFLVYASLIIGFPWETAPDIRRTYDLHVSLLRRGAKSELSTLCPLPGTALERACPLEGSNGISNAGSDGLPHGPGAAAMVRGAPELFAQLGCFRTPAVDPRELRAFARAGSMVANHYGEVGSRASSG